MLRIRGRAPNLTKRSPENLQKWARVDSFDQLVSPNGNCFPTGTFPPSHIHTRTRTCVPVHTHRRGDNSKNIFRMGCFAFEICFVILWPNLGRCHRPADARRPKDPPPLARRGLFRPSHNRHAAPDNGIPPPLRQFCFVPFLPSG